MPSNHDATPTMPECQVVRCAIYTRQESLAGNVAGSERRSIRMSEIIGPDGILAGCLAPKRWA